MSETQNAQKVQQNRVIFAFESGGRYRVRTCDIQRVKRPKRAAQLFPCETALFIGLFEYSAIVPPNFFLKSPGESPSPKAL